jgi:hypothetical protein
MTDPERFEVWRDAMSELSARWEPIDLTKHELRAVDDEVDVELAKLPPPAKVGTPAEVLAKVRLTKDQVADAGRPGGKRMLSDAVRLVLVQRTLDKQAVTP